ncbi:3-hydroxyacyl-CoA dehydrogenase [Paracoccus sp. pheM1]|uniref:3-hydroxyacyl-CoA dehydrogenase n=1 Tax=Paracoccus sp. pheM1 TaxID=2831675 RepID=UPI001BDB8470|nr:3-hydroxyacyl-CoA dehydrogenase [Paracoccus sp. pheM1]MBT0783061.1 3-hydroxyacyl-CoA dehydrogenase [Paracoccus sp. pheM1]
MKTAAIIGAGLIGQGWAIVFARAGWNVNLYDPNSQAAEKGLAMIGSLLGMLKQEGLLPDDTSAANRIRIAPTLPDALAGAEYIQESAPENLEAKRALFAEMDALAAPDALLCSSTSTIPASAFTGHLAGRARCMVAHPVNPTYLIPLVELSGAPWTAANHIERAKDILLDVGQRPIVVRKEIEGFVMNRLQGAVLHEAFRLFSEGIASGEDIDATIKHGLGLRWAFIGPFETIDLNSPQGIEEYCERYAGVYESIGASLGKCVDWNKALRQGLADERKRELPRDQLEAKRLWRDQKLMQMVRQLYHAG